MCRPPPFHLVFCSSCRRCSLFPVVWCLLSFQDEGNVPTHLSPFLVDGVNVAFEHGRQRRLSPVGIAYAVAGLFQMGFPVQVIVPYWFAHDAGSHEALFLNKRRGVEECRVLLEVSAVPGNEEESRRERRAGAAGSLRETALPPISKGDRKDLPRQVLSMPWVTCCRGIASATS